MAGSAVIGTLRAILALDTAQFETASARMSQSAKQWTRDFNSVGQQATRLGTTLTTALTLPLLGLGAGAAKLAMDFESSFAGVKKTVDATEPEFAKMAQAFRDLSKQIPVNVNELNRLGEAAGALGIPKGEIVDFTRVMALLGVTTNLTSEQAATSIGKIQNIFGAAGKSTENFASSLVALGNAGASTETEIVEMAARIAGAGNVIGITQAEVLGFASTLASVGINAEAGGSAISRVFLKMNDAVSSGGSALAEFARVAGMSSAQFKQAFETDAAGAVTTFIKGLGAIKVSGENVNGTIEGLVGKNIILKDTLLRVSGAGDLLADQLKIGNQAWKDNTALTAEAEKRFQTTEAQMTLLWNKVKDVGITLGNALLPAIKEAIRLFDGLVPYLESAARWFGELNPKIQLGIVGFLGLVAAAGPALVLFGQMSIGLGTLTAAFTAQGIATKGLAASIGLFQTASAFLVPALLAVATAIAGWQIGKAIGEVTGLTGVIQSLTEKVMGYRDASEPMESQQRLINQAIKLGAAEGINFADAMAFLQKRSAELRATSAQTTQAIDKQKVATHEAGVSTKDAAEAVKAKEKADKAAEKAAAELTHEIERQKAAMHALGITTKQDVNEEMGKLLEGFSLALAAGVPLKTATAALTTKLEDLAKKAKASNAEVDELTVGLRQLQAQMLVLDPIPAKLMGKTDFSAITKGLQTVSLEASKATVDSNLLTDAYHSFGLKTPAELAAVAAASRQHYSDLVATGTATKDQLNEAWEQVLEAEKLGRKDSVSIWKQWGKEVVAIGQNALRGLTSALVGFNGKTADEHQRAEDEKKDAYEDTQKKAEETLDKTVRASQDAHNDMVVAANEANHRQVQDANDAYEAIVSKAEDSYQRALASGTASEEELMLMKKEMAIQQEEAAKERDRKIAEASQKALDDIKASTEKHNAEVLDATKKHDDEVEAAHKAMVDAMEANSHHFRDNLNDIWKDIVGDFKSLVAEMLATFIEKFIGGALAALFGSRGSFGSAFAGLFNFGGGGGGGLGSSLLGGALGGGAAGGGVPTVAGYGASGGYGAAAGGASGGVTAGSILGGAGIGIAFMETLAPGFFKNVFTSWGGMSPEQTLQEQYDAIAGYRGSNSDEAQNFLLNNPGFVPGYAMGSDGFRDFGTGTLAMLHGVEAVVPMAAAVEAGAFGGGSVTVQLVRDGRKEAQWLVPFIPEEVFRLELA